MPEGPVIAMFALLAAMLASMEAYRQRLSKLMGSLRRPDAYPTFVDRGSLLMGVLVIWSGEHREYRDPWLTGFAWAARLTMLPFAALPLLSLADLLMGQS